MPFSFLRIVFAAVALHFASMAMPALAKPVDLEIKPDQEWKHKWTKMSFPARLGGFQRDRIVQFEERETNVAGVYEDPTTGSLLTLYIYRPGNPSTAIWFDRALIAIGAREKVEQLNNFGSIDLDNLKIGSFTPSGGTVDSGQFAVVKLDANYSSTAVALYRAGEWLVKIRLSSRELSVTGMDGLLKSTIAGLPQLDDIDSFPAQYVNQCDDNIEIASAEPVEVNGALALGLGISDPDLLRLSSAEMGSEEASSEGPATHCRAGPRRSRYNLYRPYRSKDRYILALGDSGTSIEVYLDETISSLQRELTGQKASIYVVRVASGVETRFHTPFSGLPSIENVSQISMQSPPVVTVSRPLSEDDNSTITVNPSIVGDE